MLESDGSSWLILLVFFFLPMLFFGFIATNIASGKGRSKLSGFLLGFLLGILGIIIIAKLPAIQISNKLNPSTPLQRAEHTTWCSICNTQQVISRITNCNKCGKPLCDYPEWKSPFESVDKIAGALALIVLCIGTAFSVLGGIILVGILAAIYFGLRSTIGNTIRPIYWRNCGINTLSGYFCPDCAPTSISDTATNYSRSDNATSLSADDSSYYDNEDDDDDDDDDNNDNSGNLWDGWAVKH